MEIFRGNADTKKKGELERWIRKKKEKNGGLLHGNDRFLSDVLPFQREMEEMFEEFWKRPWARPRFGVGWPLRRRFWEDIGFQGPAVEIYEEENDVVVRAELPGLKKEEIDVNVSENLITIKGEKKSQEEKKKEGYYYSECSFGSFERSIEIPREVQMDKTRASFKDGVLEVRLPKTEEAKRKETKIKVE